MKLETLEELLLDQLKDLYSAETQLTKALPKMAKKASNPVLTESINGHLKETEGHVERLHTIEGILSKKLSGKKCKAMAGLIEEGAEALEATGDETLIDLLIVAAAQRVEHYEIAAYGTARSIAEQLDETEIAQLLQETLDEESTCNEKLTEISFEELYPQVSDDLAAEEDDEDGAASHR